MLQPQDTKTRAAESNSESATVDMAGMVNGQLAPQHDGLGVGPPATVASEEPTEIRRRATDDPATPIPKRSVATMAGSFADAVGSAVRYLRRATDPRPEEVLPDLDAATPELRRRIQAVQAETDAKPGFLRWWFGPAAPWRNRLR